MKVKMNGGFGGAAFDFGDSFGYGGTNGDAQDQQQHQQQQHQQRFMQNAPQFDAYDPAAIQGNPVYQYNPTYNSTASTHRTFLPPIDGTNAAASLHINNAHMMQQQQQQQQQYIPSNQVYLQSPAAFMPPLDSIQSLQSPEKLLSSTSILPFQNGLFPDPMNSTAKQADKARKANPDLWLENMRIKCSDVSLEPLSGTEVLKRVRAKTDDVVTRYLPCVEFLVACQQDLRAGLAAATQKRLVRHAYRDSMTPKEFYKRYLNPLPDRFYQRNTTLMENQVLNSAVVEISKLCQDSKRVEYQGCEIMKNTFLGGMKDGESWGLRKWLSTHGGALHICNDLECILRSCQDLDRSQDTTRQLSERLRPLAKQALERLKNDVPASYQEVSTAHPYLPFFHRLESALKGMANFDPEDDDVICIDDDDEIEEVKHKSHTKRKQEPFSGSQPNTKKQRLGMEDLLADLKPAARAFQASDEDSVIEISDIKPQSRAAVNNTTTNDFSAQETNQDWECPRCTMLNAPETRRCCMCDRTVDGRDCDSEDDDNAFKGFTDFPFDETAVGWDPIGVKGPERDSVSPLLAQLGASLGGGGNNGGKVNMDVNQMVAGLENIARAADVHQHRSLRPSDIVFEEAFWDVGPEYASAVRLLISILRNQDSRCFFDPPDDHELQLMGLPAFSSMVKHPLCMKDIVLALLSNSSEQSLGNGKLALKSLSCWNMWRGMDLLQALDLVLLNNLAYNGKEKTKERSATNRLRRVLWEGINGVITVHVGNDLEKRRQLTPTRRGESSGFVVRK